jgi:hypothetical protein
MSVIEIGKAGVMQFGVRVHRAGEYPEKFRDAEDPVEVLYYRGWWDLLKLRRSPSSARASPRLKPLRTRRDW